MFLRQYGKDCSLRSGHETDLFANKTRCLLSAVIVGLLAAMQMRVAAMTGGRRSEGGQGPSTVPEGFSRRVEARSNTSTAARAIARLLCDSSGWCPEEDPERLTPPDEEGAGLIQTAAGPRTRHLQRGLRERPQPLRRRLMKRGAGLSVSMCSEISCLLPCMRRRRLEDHCLSVCGRQWKIRSGDTVKHA
ncbi:hypothetical protein ABIE85_006689 [Bradyrhizobium diazoefficiens]